MRTWEDYKTYVKSIDQQAEIDIEEAESLAAFVTAMIKQLHKKKSTPGAKDSKYISTYSHSGTQLISFTS